jgi:adenine-specific DNA-methyltransferase
VKEYTNRKAFDGFREVSPYYMGKMDLWYGFACHGIDLLKQEGTLCFIAQNNWTTSAGAKKMRNKVISDSQILQLLDFNTYMVFENAEIQTMVMLFKRIRDVDDYEFDYRIITQCNEKEDMLALLTKRKRNTKYLLPIINRNTLKDNLLTFSESNLIFDKITKDKTYLKDNEIAQGIVFPQDFLNKQGANKLGNKYPIGIGIFGLDQSEKDSMILNEKELELIQPYFTTEQIHRYYTDNNNTQWMIYTDSSFKNADKMKDYPHIKEHLDKFIEIFTSDNKPYGLHRCRKQMFFQGEKIISLRKCVGKPCFSYSNFDCYVTQTFFSIKSSRWNMKFLTGILNSKLIAFWLKNKGKMQGCNYQIDKEPLLGIPLPIIELARQQPIISLVECILIKKGQDMQIDILPEEREIDKLVYELYGLTEEEIKIIEQSI